MKTTSLLLSLASMLPGPLPAQAPEPAKEASREDLEARVRKLEEELQALKRALAEKSTITPEPTARIGGAGASAAKALNPDISMIGDLLGSVGHDPVRPVPSLDMHEAELGLRATVDPYSRGDVFLSFADGKVEVEEAYLTFTALPGGFTGKVGKLRAEFGRVNPAHTHTLPWTDRPLVIENLVNGEDGISDMGLSLSRILPAPGDLFLEATAQVLRGSSGDLFTASRRKDVSFVGRLRGYLDLTENANLETGFSYARGHNELGSDFRTTLNGADFTFRWKPLARSIYRSFLWRTEAVWSRRDQLDGTVRTAGGYSNLEFRLNQRWTLGARADWSGRATAAAARDRGGSLLATYWFSEFSQLRGQYRRTRYDGGRDAAELRMQLLFVLGAHGAHPF